MSWAVALPLAAFLAVVLVAVAVCLRHHRVTPVHGWITRLPGRTR